MPEEEVRIERFQHRLAVVCVIGCLLMAPFVTLYKHVFGGK